MDIKELDIFSRSHQSVRHPWEAVRLKIVQRLLYPVFKTMQRGVLLDIGCGDAYVLRHLARQEPGFSYIGMDSAFTKESIEHIKPDCPANIRFCSSLADIDASEGIQMALLLDVLEHVEEDGRLLGDAASYLQKNGYLLITVPAFQRLYCRHDEWLGHYRRYSKKKLLNIVQAAGLTPVQSGYFFSALLIPRILSKLSELVFVKRSTRPVTGIGEWEYGTVLGSVIRRVLYWNGCFDVAVAKAGIPFPGLSIFALCRKY